MIFCRATIPETTPHLDFLVCLRLDPFAKIKNEGSSSLVYVCLLIEGCPCFCSPFLQFTYVDGCYYK